MTGKSGERSGLDREDTEDKEDTEGDTDSSICFLEGEEGVEGGDGKKGEEGGDKESEASLSPYTTHDVNNHYKYLPRSPLQDCKVAWTPELS